VILVWLTASTLENHSRVAVGMALEAKADFHPRTLKGLQSSVVIKSSGVRLRLPEIGIPDLPSAFLGDRTRNPVVTEASACVTLPSWARRQSSGPR
jgi:hypothetical protein